MDNLKVPPLVSLWKKEPPKVPSLGCPNILLCIEILALFGMVGGGCVQRRLTIRTDPPGAMAYVDGYPIGTTPISTDFIYYGTREIRLVKDGYETVVSKQRINPPWYEIPPLDFVSENLLPGELRDHRTLEFRLQPQRITPPEQLVDRAERLRRGEVFLPSAHSGLSGAAAPDSVSGPASRGVNPPGAAGSGGTIGPGSSRPAAEGGPSRMDVVPGADIGGRTVFPLPGAEGPVLP